MRLARTDRGAGEGRVFTGDRRFRTGLDTRPVDELLHVDGLAPVALSDRVRSVSPDGRFALHDNGPALAVAALDGPLLPSFERPAWVIVRSTDGTRTTALDAEGRLRAEGPGSYVRLEMAIGRYGRRRTGAEFIDPARDSVAFSDDERDARGPHPRRRRSAAGPRAPQRHRRRALVDAGDRRGAAAFLTEGTVLAQGYGRPEVLRYDAFTSALLGTGGAGEPMPLSLSNRGQLRTRGAGPVSSIAVASMKDRRWVPAAGAL